MTQDIVAQDDAKKQLLNRCFFSFAISGLGATLLGSLMPYLRDTYQLSFSFSGILLSVHSVGNLASTLIAGFLPFLIGRRKSILFFSVWMFFAYSILAISGFPPLLMLAFFLVGISRGGVCNFGNVMVGSLKGGSRDLNLLHACFSLGACVSPLLLFLFSFLIPDVGWKFAVGAMAFISVFQVVTFWKMQIPERSRDTSKKRTIDRSFLKERSYWLSGLILLFYISAEYGISGWLVTYFKESGLMSEGFAQIMSALLWGEMLFGRLINARISSRVSRRALLFINGIGFTVFFMVLFFSRSMLGIAIGIIGFGFFMAGIYPLAVAGVSTKTATNDMAMSLLVTAGSIGAIAMPAIIGFVSGAAGIVGGMSLLIFIVSATLILICLDVFLPRNE